MPSSPTQIADELKRLADYANRETMDCRFRLLMKRKLEELSRKVRALPEPKEESHDAQ